MSKTTAKPQPMVAVRIEPGEPTPAQREAWRCLWQKLIAEVRAGER